MDVHEIKSIPNPYGNFSVKLNLNEFVGREQEINELQVFLEGYQRTMTIQNILISGEKSMGKSCLLHRYKQLCNSYKLEVFEKEFGRDENIEISEFEFFKEIFDQFFISYHSSEENLFNGTQSEIWFSLTRDKYEHDSTYLDRQIEFATIYSNYKKGSKEHLSLKVLINDFNKILDQIIIPGGNIDVIGIALLLDEIQELKRNTHLLDLLRGLSENIPQIFIIGAGLPTFIGTPIFEKFLRTSKVISLSEMTKSEILEMIYSPFKRDSNYTRYEIMRFYDHDSINKVIYRANGNPLHVKILCNKMFDHFVKNPDQKKIKITRAVMEDVMTFFANISEKSNRIQNALMGCASYQLESFNRLYKYEGLNFRAGLILKNAFNSLCPESLNELKEKVVEDFITIDGLGLFEMNGCEVDIDQIKNMNINESSQYKYSFIGTQIDKLYVAYYYEDLTKDTLFSYENNRLEDLLADKLSNEFQLAPKYQDISEYLFENNKLVSVLPQRSDKDNGEEFISDIDKLIEYEKKHKKCEDVLESVNSITNKYNLHVPALISTMLEYSGYYLLSSVVTIKGRKYFIQNYYPVKGDTSNIVKKKENIEDFTRIINASLDDYSIEINWMHLYWIPSNPLQFICYIDISDESDTLLKLVKEKEFELALKSARKIQTLNTRFRKDHVSVNVASLNNYAFCLINVNDLDKALEIFEDIKDKYLLSSINAAFIKFYNGDLPDAYARLKRIYRRQVGKDYDDTLLHLAIKHKKLSFKDLLITDQIAYNVVLWNLALINIQLEGKKHISSSFLKKVVVNSKSYFIHERVKYWIVYFGGDISQALSETQIIKEKCNDMEICNSIENDIDIFSSEI